MTTTKYEFCAVRWCDSMKKANFARKDFVTAENFKQTRMRIEELEACVAELKNMFDDAMQTNHFLEGGISALRARVARMDYAAVHIYNSGYHAGHHDTVEGGYVDIHPSDMDSYHAEEVSELLAALVGDE